MEYLPAILFVIAIILAAIIINRYSDGTPEHPRKLKNGTAKVVRSAVDKEVVPMDKILSFAKSIIDNGEIVSEDVYRRGIPFVEFKDNNDNTLYISWYATFNDVKDVLINNKCVPTTHDDEILQLAQKRIQVLRKEHLEKVIDSVK